MSTKEELQAQLKALQEQEELEAIAKHYPELKKLEGKCYRYANTYGGGKDAEHWWLYIKIVSITEEDIHVLREGGIHCQFNGISFQTDKYGEISINPSYKGYIGSCGEEITETQFNKQWNKLLSKLTGLIGT